MDASPLDYFSENFSNLPPKLKEVFFSDEWGEKIRGIGERHKLHVDDMGTLFDEVSLVLLGKVQAQDFGEHLAAALRTTPIETAPLLRDLDKEIFSEIRKRLTTATETEEEAESLSKDDILREIETPSPARFRTEPTTNASLIEKHNERVLGSSVTPPKAPEIPTEVEPTLPAPVALDHELPPHTENPPVAQTPTPEPRNEVTPQAPKEESAPIIQSPRKVTEVHPELRPAVRKGSVDPYREPIE